jgi:hypothetical protein
MPSKNSLTQSSAITVHKFIETVRAPNDADGYFVYQTGWDDAAVAAHFNRDDNNELNVSTISVQQVAKIRSENSAHIKPSAATGYPTNRMLMQQVATIQKTVDDDHQKVETLQKTVDELIDHVTANTAPGEINFQKQRWSK